MNNIYKVIWSKAKNCYVVASEIARSHTKSATGSEKIGGVTRRSLLASLMALSLLCGGLGVASAADVVHVDESATGTHEVYTKAKVDTLLNDKADATALDGKANTSLDNLSDAGKSVIKDTMADELAKKANATALDGKANTSLDNLSDAGKSVIKDTMAGELAKKADKTYVDNAITAAEGKIGDNTTAIGKLQAKDAELEGKITTLDGKVTTAEGEINNLKAKDNELAGNIQTNADNIQTNKNDIATIKQRTAGIKRDDVRDETTIEGNVTVDKLGNVTAKGKLIGDGVAAGAGDITTTGAVNAGSLKVENDSNLKGDVTMGNKLTVTGDTSLKKTDVDGALNVTGESSLKNTKVDGTLTTTGKATFKEAVEMDKGLTVTSGDTTLKGTKVDGALNVTGASDLKNTKVDGTLTTTGKATFKEAVEMDKGLTVTNGATTLKETTVDGKLTAGDADLKNTKVEGTLGVTGEATLDGALTAKGEAKFEKNVTVEKDLTVNGKLNVGEIYMEHNKLESTGEQHNSATSITADGISNLAKVTEHGNTTESQFTHNKKGTFNYAKDGNTTDWKESTSNVTADGVKTEAKDSKGNRTNTSQTADGIKGYATDKYGNKTYTKVTATENSFQVQDKDGKNKNHQVNTMDKSVTAITNADGKTTKTEQTATDITNTAKDGTIKNDAKDIVNNASGNMTNTVGSDLTTTVGGNELHEVTGTKTENVTGKVTENYKAGQETNVTGDQDIYVTGKQTNKIDGDQENTIGGNQTTTVTGDISNKAENITNEANTKLTDKVGDHTRVLDSEGITDTVGGSTFKQRIDKIMMESKDVSIKAEETLTNEAKVITNKASEVINNEAVNINNTATGIITSKASEIQNQADRLISNKVGENTWENMEDGKITTSIKNGTKQNLTQSDAEKTEHSVVNGSNSTVNKQTSEEITDAVTNGTTTNVTQNTATSSNNTIADKNGNANTVISTADGTSFINSKAAAPVTGASGDGTEVKTTIKGNTITTGKVTMDYADVMKDLGVRGNANITGTTTTKTLKVTENATVGGTLDVTQKATFHDDVDIKKNLSVDGNATIKGDVTASSYKVGDKTYISAAGINANDQKITNVADGSISEGSKDAVNGGQLYTVKNDLEGKVNKVGANAAAMANLHPMEFDPDSKWNVAAAIGNYGSETAAALGAFYRPNDDVMVNLSTAFGTGENMVGGGVSVRLGKGGNKLSREENNALKAQVADLTARMDALLSVLNPNMSKDFPDVPENHWAYEAVSRLAGNDIVQGYPDGEFHGERTMTRYEMAEIIYNALSRGAEAERELVKEFKPELQAMAASEKATAERAEG